jgi:hypothetical protein
VTKALVGRSFFFFFFFFWCKAIEQSWAVIFGWVWINHVVFGRFQTSFVR